MSKCNCIPKLYYWQDCACSWYHGYFYGCKEHNLRTALSKFQDIAELKQDWDNGSCYKGGSYLIDAVEIKEESK